VIENNDITDNVPANISALNGLDLHIPDEYNASEILFNNIKAGRISKTAIFDSLGETTYGELCDTASKVGNALKRLGLPRFSRILMILDDISAYPAAIFGAMRAGFVPVLINTLSPSDLIQYYLEDSGSTVALIDSDFLHLLTTASISNTQLRTVIVLNGNSSPLIDTECLHWDDWLRHESVCLEAANTHKNDMAFWMYSSGSTGRPKGIVHLHHDMAYTYSSYAKQVLELTENDVCLSPPKIFFAYGYGNSLTFPFMVGASTVLISGRPDPKKVFEAIRRYKPTIFFGLPTLYNSMINDKSNNDANLDCIRLCISAAETLSQDLYNSWKYRFGLNIIEGLGSTEVLHIYLSNTSSHYKVGAAGRIVTGYEVELRNEKGLPIKKDEPGVLWVRGDSNSPCYWNKPEKTSETMKDGWIYTGDRFEVDDDGFYYFRGRADDLIKVSGQWVYPLEIELCLAGHPYVKECAVLGVELADKRMTTKAFIVLNEGCGADDVLTSELKEYAKEKLLPHKYPRSIVYLEFLPKTGSGKIDRQKLT
jgi:acetyl-CoA synthetase